MSHVVERVKYGKRGDGALVKFSDSPRWISCLYVNGREVRESTRTTELKAARRFHKQKLDEVALDRQGVKPFQTPIAKRVTVGELLDALAADYEIRKIRSMASARSHIKLVREQLGDARAVDVTSDRLDRLTEDLLEDEYRPSSVNRALQTLGQALRLALERGKIQTVPKIRLLPERNARQGFFEQRELEALVAELPEFLRDVVRFGFLTGWRRGEILTLEWGDVDMQGKAIRLRAEHAKNGAGRTIAMDDYVLLELMRRREKDRLQPTGVAGLVFHKAGRAIPDFRDAWAAACVRAGLAVTDPAGKVIPDRLFHDLRRSAVRRMVRGGVPQSVAMQISGHKTASMFRRYDITDERDLRAAAETIGRLYQQPASNPEGAR